MSEHYKLEGREVVACSLYEWGLWFERNDRHVGSTKIMDSWVSTVMLGLDSSFGDGPPLIFETMVFGGEFDEYQWKHHTYDEAEMAHTIICEEVFASNVKPFIQIFNITICAFLLTLMALGAMLLR